MHALRRVRGIAGLLLCACARAGGGESPQTGGAAAAVESPAVHPADSAFHVIITLRRDSLALSSSDTPQQTTSRIDAALARIRQTVDFDVLAISAPILAANVHPRPPMSVADLVNRLRNHPLVAAAEPSGVVRTP